MSKEIILTTEAGASTTLEWSQYWEEEEEEAREN
jgi:hypothetical protein